ncbi:MULTISPECIES: hypothetical protein [unclassified Pseudomonas]|uniref:hypothetical protein n=1 Tax=unclassified Pseudomonas TaxID=196821 RepID=UPI0015AB8139|nr:MULTISPECIES: hypothetical protein [unclassified Pseudomonas]
MNTSHYKYIDRPGFLEGCFYWKGRGYHFAAAPPAQLLAPGAWQDDDPWMALAAILESAKRGDFSHVSRLREVILDEASVPTLVSACLGLTADAGLESDLDFLAELMIQGPDHLRIEASLAAQWSGVMWLVPFMVEARCALERQADREAVEANISNLLDPLEGEPEFYDSSLDDAQYRHAVDTRLAQLQAPHGNDRLSILAGTVVDVNRQAWLMRKALVPNDPDAWLDWSNFLLWRRTFEVYSGIDCSSFYDRHGQFQPLNASAVLDQYLASPLQLEIGRRYFFGRLVV